MFPILKEKRALQAAGLSAQQQLSLGLQAGGYEQASSTSGQSEAAAPAPMRMQAQQPAQGSMHVPVYGYQATGQGHLQQEELGAQAAALGAMYAPDRPVTQQQQQQQPQGYYFTAPQYL